MTLRERFEEMGVPCPKELPRDMRKMVDAGLQQGRVLCIQQIKNEDGVVSNQWSFLADPRPKRAEIIPDPTKPPPYDPDEL